MSDASDEVQWLTEAEREAWLAVAALTVKLPAALDAQLQSAAGLSFFEYMVLAVLSEQPDRAMQMSDIAAFASASLSRLSHTATRLEKQGLITRKQVPGHGRRTQATLTDAGLEKVRATAAQHVMHVRRVLIDGLTPEDLASLARIGGDTLRRIEGRGGDSD
jgi:DNA-binding MarR family transcriptional regulator